jgi:hypothetical protein
MLINLAMLTVSILSMAQQTYRLQVEEEEVSRYGGELQLFWISINEQFTEGCSSSLGVGWELKTPNDKKRVIKCRTESQIWADSVEWPK